MSEEIENKKYNITIKKIKEILLNKINNFNGENEKIRLLIENLFRNILMKNPKAIIFQDRTIFEIDIKNIVSANNQNQNQGNIYKGFITSAHITESGLYMLINNKNKLITGKTALKKMIEIRNKLKEKKNLKIKEIFEEIRNYFFSHRIVLTGYGSIKTYKIKGVNFDRNPTNTNISVKDSNGIKRNISIINYYKNQYKIDIKDKNQPLFEAENNTTKNHKLLSSDNNIEKEGDNKIYLIPELVYITGIEDDDNQNNRNNKCNNINNMTEDNPSMKMSAINVIKDFVNSNP